MKFLRILPALALVAALTSCEEVIDYKLRETDEKTVVQGWVTDQPGPYTVRITGTKGYLAPGEVPTRDADLVTITDVEANVVDTLRRTAAGTYQTTAKLGTGQINHSYRLLVVRGSQRIEATTRLKPCSPLDSINFTYRSPRTDLVSDSGYYTTIYFREPLGRGDYYRVNFYSNDEWRNRNELFFFDDELYDGNYGDAEIGGYPTHLHDTVTIQMLSIDKAAYDFYTGLANSQYQSGTPFDSPPANAPTNLSGGALGFFGASQVRSVTRIVR
jgi:Domain of unknown function (DUF4249)